MFLQLNFFKRLGFTTKKDGLKLIENTPAIQEHYDLIHNKIKLFEQQEIDSFFDIINTEFSQEKNLWLSNEKNEIQLRKSQKSLDQKTLFKSQLKDEIRKELIQENIDLQYPQLALAKSNLDYINVLQSQYCDVIHSFYSKNLITPELIQHLLKIKQQLSTCENVLSSIHMSLASLTK